MLIPALNYAERDRLEGRLRPKQEEALVGDATRELMHDVVVATREAQAANAALKRPETPVATEDPPAAKRVTVLSYPATSAADEVALQMLALLLDGDTPSRSRCCRIGHWSLS